MINMMSGGIEGSSNNSNECEKTSIHVSVRVRPLNEREEQENEIYIVRLD
jgi:hypothetical protein